MYIFVFIEITSVNLQFALLDLSIRHLNLTLQFPSLLLHQSYVNLLSLPTLLRCFSILKLLELRRISWDLTLILNLLVRMISLLRKAFFNLVHVFIFMRLSFPDLIIRAHIMRIFQLIIGMVVVVRRLLSKRPIQALLIRKWLKIPRLRHSAKK